MRIIAYILFCLSCFSCTHYSPYSNGVNSFLLDYGKEVTDKHEEMNTVSLFGSLYNEFNPLYLEFKSHKECDVEEARRYILPIITNFIAQVNVDKEMVKLLHKTPITIEDIDVRVRFVDKKGEYRPYPYVSYLFTMEDKICYFSYKDKELKPIFVDTLEEEKKILQQDQKKKLES